MRNVLSVGLVLLTLGLLFFTQVSPHGTYLGDLAPGFVLAGASASASRSSPSRSPRSRASRNDEAGLASGLINTSQQIGGAVGVALLATIATNHAENALSSGSTTNPQQALVDGWHLAFAVAAVLAVALVAVTWTMISSTVAQHTAAEPARVADA